MFSPQKDGVQGTSKTIDLVFLRDFKDASRIVKKMLEKNKGFFYMFAGIALIGFVGEAAGSPMFTHISEDDFRIVRDNLAGGKRNTGDRLIPYCMFTDPPLAHVGLSEREAERQGVKTRIAKLPMKAVLRAQAAGETEGFMKALVAENDDRILGFTMIGAQAGEVMAVVHTAMMANLPYTKLRDADFAHPTFAEGLNFLFSNTPARPQ